jgi:hypothetical protein
MVFGLVTTFSYIGSAPISVRLIFSSTCLVPESAMACRVHRQIATGLIREYDAPKAPDTSKEPATVHFTRPTNTLASNERSIGAHHFAKPHNPIQVEIGFESRGACDSEGGPADDVEKEQV